MNKLINILSLITILWAAIPAISLAHNSVAEDSSLVNRLMEEGISNYNRGNYTQADLIFRKVLGLKVIIPDDFCYYYGKTLYNLRNYKLSQSFLKKYQELTNYNGEFSQSANESLIILAKKIAAIDKCADCDENGFLVSLQECHICEGDGKTTAVCTRCRGRGEEICPTCMGEGVEVFRTSFGRRYVACTTCNESGHIECRKCLGTGEEFQLCPTCKGVGKLEVKKRIIE